MNIAAWPSTLPCFLVAGNEYLRHNNIESTEFSNGYERKRLKRKGPVTFNVTLKVTDEQLEQLEAWIEYELKGVGWFTAPLKTGSGIDDWVVRLNTKALNPKQQTKNRWLLGLSLSARKQNYLTLSSYLSSFRNKQSKLGTSTESSSAIILPAIEGNLSIYPALNRFPSDSLFPVEGNFDEYSFTVTSSADFSAGLVVSSTAFAGENTIPINPAEIIISVVNPWDPVMGVRPAYENALRAAKENENYARVLLHAGDKIVVNSKEVLTLSSDLKTGESTIYLISPLINSVPAGEVIN